MGVFSRNKKIFPNLLVDGCYLEFTLAGIRNSFRQVDSATPNRRLKLNPLFKDVDNAGAGWTTATGSNKIVCELKNSILSPQSLPFVIGETLGVTKADGTDYDFDVPPTIKSIEMVGADALARVEITLDAVSSPTVDIPPVTNDHFLYSTSLKGTGVYEPSYLIRNVEMIVHQIEMDAQYEKGMLSKVREKGGVIEFDIPSITCHTHSTLASDLQSTIPLNIEFARAKSIICVPTDASIYSTQNQSSANTTYMESEDQTGYIEDVFNRSNRTGLTGCSNNLSSYSFFLNGRQVPSKDISCKKTTDKAGGVDANFIIELEKGLSSAGIDVNSFEDYNRNFVVSRMLALGENAVFDGRGRSCRLNCKYEGSVVGNVNLLWKNFIAHHRKLVIKGNDISVEV
jgi:hypothetical protein